MKPYPKNNIPIKPITPYYTSNETTFKNSRYSTYRIIDNLVEKPLEVKLEGSITRNSTFNGYYYTTEPNETLYSIAKKYYGSETFYWILAKANGIRDGGLSILPANTVIIVPNYNELQKTGGYFNQK